MRRVRIGFATAVVALLVIVTGVLAPMLAIDFVNDDIGIIQFALHGARPNFGALLTRAEVIEVYYRPLFDLTLALDHVVWGWTPFGYRLTNLALHLSCTLLVVSLARALRFGRTSAVVAGLVFGLHPIHEMSLYWIAGRTDVLCAALYLLSLWLFLRWRSRRSTLLYVASLLAAAMAMLAKEMAITLPIVVALVDWWMHGVERQSDASHSNDSGTSATVPRMTMSVRRGLPYAAIIACVIVGRIVALDNNMFGAHGAHGAVGPLTLARNVATYLGLLIIPVGHETLGQALRSSPLFVPLAIAALASVAAVAWRFRRHAAPAIFCLGLVLVSLAPVSRLMMRWYLYLPSAFFALGVGWLASRLAHAHRGTAAALAGALLLCFAIVDIDTIGRWIAAGEIATSTAHQLRALLPAPRHGDTLRFATVPAKIGATPVHHLGFRDAVRHALDDQTLVVELASKLMMPAFPAAVRTTVDSGADRDRVRLTATHQADASEETAYFVLPESSNDRAIADGRPARILHVSVAASAADAGGRATEIVIRRGRSSARIHWLTYDGRAFQLLPR